MNYISQLRLKNWRNFQELDVALGDRVFVIGPNASGKSNLLDAFRFLGDICQESGGGLQGAVRQRDGLKKLRCLSARKDPEVEIEITISRWDRDPAKQEELWRYCIGMVDGGNGASVELSREQVWHRGSQILNRPDDKDQADPKRLRQTLLQQSSANEAFREIATFLESLRYLHLVPQLVKHASQYVMRTESPVLNDPSGLDFMARLAGTEETKRNEMLARIEKALAVCVPQFRELKFVHEDGQPHLQVTFTHWRPHGARQREDQFSDGTIRLIGLFWAVLDEGGTLLLEEPELSLNSDIVSQIPGLIHGALIGHPRQIIVSTHSFALLSDAGIGLEEVLLLEPNTEGTVARNARNLQEARLLVEGGLTTAEAVMPYARPADVADLQL